MGGLAFISLVAHPMSEGSPMATYGGERLVLKISGKIIDPTNAPTIKKYGGIVRDLHRAGHRVVVVVGGGPTARSYISCARELGLSEAQADIIGIEASRLNALLLAYAVGDEVYLPIPRSIEEFLRAWVTGKVVVLGGLQPGQSTAAVAAVIAETVGARKILYASDVDGVYDKDPRRYGDARRLDVVCFDEVQRFVRQSFEAGGYELLDPVALAVAKRGNVEVTVFNGLVPENVYEALRGSVGTRITPC